jgi:hypothetical protein
MKRITLQETADLVTFGMWLDYTASRCQPGVYDAASAKRRDQLHGIRIRSCLTFQPRAVLEVAPDVEVFHSVSLHSSG